MQYWKFLHILSMFAGVTLLFGTDALFHRAAGARDITALRKLVAWSGPLVAAGIVLVLAGIGFGFATAIVGPFDLTQGWLIAAYVLVGAIIVLGFAVETPYQNRIGRALEATRGETPSPELDALLRSPIRHVSWVSAALYGAVIFVMVVKPF